MKNRARKLIRSSLFTCSAAASYVTSRFSQEPVWLSEEALDRALSLWGGDFGTTSGVYQPGIPDATTSRATWKQAILWVTPDSGKFYLGFGSDPGEKEQRQFLARPIRGGVVGVLVGPGDVWFYARGTKERESVSVDVIEVTTQDDPKWRGLRRY